MDILLDPNIAYLLLAGGLALAVLAILNPGTGLLEITALFALLLSGWIIFNLVDQINWWALLVIFAGMLLFLVTVYRFGHLLLLAAAITAVVIGSAFLFHGLQWWMPAVNPILTASVGILSGGFFWVADHSRPFVRRDLGIDLQPPCKTFRAGLKLWRKPACRWPADISRRRRGIIQRTCGPIP